jgi:hypothetical protein
VTSTVCPIILDDLPDTLSRPNGTDIPDNHRELALLLPELFIKIADVDSDNSLKDKIVKTQCEQLNVLKDWATQLPIQQVDMEHTPM